MKYFPLFALMALLTRGTWAKPSPEGTLPSITSEVEKEEIYDLPFQIVESKRNGKYSEIVGKGTYKGRVVGLRFKIEGQWSRPKNGEIVAGAGPVYLESIGKESDDFIKALDETYKVRQGVLKFKSSGALVAAAFGGMKQDIEDGTVNFKIFSESENESEYFEFFITYHPKANRIWLGEKDEEYRAAIVKRIGKK